MTEEQWLTSTDVHGMLQFYHSTWRDRYEETKRMGSANRLFRLFAAGCARQIYTDPKEAALISEVEDLCDEGHVSDIFDVFRFRAKYVLLAQLTLSSAFASAMQFATSTRSSILQTELPGSYKIDILRQIFGNPFNVSLCRQSGNQLGTDSTEFDCDCRWFDGDPYRIALSLYKERDARSGLMDNVKLLVLADALEEAGCAKDSILSALRTPGRYCRGFWPVDEVLKKR